MFWLFGRFVDLTPQSVIDWYYYDEEVARQLYVDSWRNATLSLTQRTDLYVELISVAYWIVAVILVLIAAWFVSAWGPQDVWKYEINKTVIYVPHLAACTIAEYSRGTSLEVVKQSLTTKLLRLAMVNINDKIHAAAYLDSAMIIEYMISQHHFTSGLETVPIEQIVSLMSVDVNTLKASGLENPPMPQSLPKYSTTFDRDTPYLIYATRVVLCAVVYLLVASRGWSLLFGIPMTLVLWIMLCVLDSFGISPVRSTLYYWITRTLCDNG